MTSVRVWLARIGELWRGRRLDQELDEELEHHLDRLTDDFLRGGMTRDDARRFARRELGGVLHTRELVRDRRGFPMIDAFRQDVRYAVRVLLRTRSFTLVAVLTLALGIGANAAIFSLVDAVMLRPLPYAAPDRLVSIWEARVKAGPANLSTRGTSFSGKADPGRMPVAPANFVEYRRDLQAFSGMAGVSGSSKNLTGSGSPERLIGEEVTHEYFDVLGTAPSSGRVFSAAEDRPDGHPVVVISDGLWRRRFGADPRMLAQIVSLDSNPYEVIGIMPAAFQPATGFGSTDAVDFWVPAAYPADLLANHGDHEIRVVARLKPGVSTEAARAELRAYTDRLATAYPQTNTGITADLRPLREDVIRDVRLSLMVLLVAVGLILLIACVNVANLLIIRAVSKRHEVAVRFALGASRRRVMSELLTQSAVLAALGGAAGLALGAWTQGLLVRVAPTSIPRLQSVGLDSHVFVFTALAALATVVFFGLVPAWQVGRARPIEAIKGRSRSVTDTGVLRWRSVLMVSEVALSTVLLVGAGLMIKSFLTLNGVGLGFMPDHVLALNIALPETRYKTADARLAFYDALAAHVALRPGVQSVAFANRLPLRGGWGSGVLIDGVPAATPSGYLDADFQAVNPGYFATLGIPLTRGRLLTANDRKDTEAVAVVSAEFSRAFLQGGDPIGRHFNRGTGLPLITIVGVVADVRRDGRAAALNPQVFLSAAQTTLYPVRLADFAVRTLGDPRSLAPAIQQDVWAIDKELPLTNVRTLDEILFQKVADRRFQTLLFVLFAALALMLAVVGIYGVVAYAVSQRTPEIGVRMALGANRGRILRWIVGQAIGLVTLGAVAGLAGAFALSRYVATLLFEVGPTNVPTYALAAVVLGVVALASAVLAGRGATKVDPVVALRCE
jgi:predicted permease